jgi:hypothetical protein
MQAGKGVKQGLEPNGEWESPEGISEVKVRDRHCLALCPERMPRDGELRPKPGGKISAHLLATFFAAGL